MDVDFFVFGVPDGFDLWEYDEREKEHFGTFYDNSSDKEKFLVQVHPLNGNTYCYYNYLIYKDVVDRNWRDNSFFGISLRFDAYCKDALKVYGIFNYVFNFHIIGGLLQKEKGKIRYTVSRFSSKTGMLEQIKSHIFDLLQTRFSQDDFADLKDFSRVVNTGRTPLCNPKDCTEPEVIFNNLRQFGRVAISLDYPSASEQETLQKYKLHNQEAEQEYQRQIQAIRGECDRKHIDEQNSHNQELAEKEREKESALAQVNEIKAKLSLKEAEVKDLRVKIESLNREMEKLNEQLDVERAERLKFENEKINHRETQGANSKATNTNDASSETYKSESSATKMDKWINSILQIFSFIILLILLFKPNKQVAPDLSGLESKVNDVYTEVKGLQLSVNFAQNDFNEEPEIDLSKVNIDIEPYNGNGPLKKGKEYTVKALNSSEKDAVWEVTGGTKKATNDPNKIYVTPTDNNVEIIYRVGNSTKPRKVEAK